MFAGLGLTALAIAAYGLFAWQLSLWRIEMLGAAGVLLIASQFLRIQKEATTNAGSKGEIDGVCGEEEEMQTPFVFLYGHVRRLLQRAMRNGERNA